ncbi:hypothetical protein MOC16_gp366 [Klebsiella phage vB_KpM_FBKp24]|uniref:Uncharacterized protein n=1 Tax=Klebsiella phage vB_KpM_FBKp24 TaxID=2801834 RepID=A0A7U0GBY4_9CAUD|nr:hypothetical protein MOC16_gp366 [Klebsiella phage vB_KpM_FBKp24]QQV92360.1 hypothetical protein vBKpMFBKp24_047 [Klebsiella phage vB_KpM_FBKp24]
MAMGGGEDGYILIRRPSSLKVSFSKRPLFDKQTRERRV